MLKVAIIGATGYTGVELVSLLLNHPKVKIQTLTSEKSASRKFTDLFPRFEGLIDLKLQKLDPKKIASEAEFIFLCLPHHESMKAAHEFYQLDKKVVDLSADFRLHHVDTYQKWYGPHDCPEMLQKAVYGLPEIHREKIMQAQLVANPGCYPTACTLGLAPLIKNHAIDFDTIHCDAKSGTSGAGRSLQQDLLFCEVNEGLKAYKVGQHRHTPEIEQEISELAEKPIKISFTPHLIPMERGILATLYAKLEGDWNDETLRELFVSFYKKEPFVRVRAQGQFPNTQDVKQSNYCDLGIHWDSRTNRAIIISVIDNLVKGASGQAIQNMNLMMGFEEKLGLEKV